MLNGEPVTIHGDGSTTRDFCHVDNVVQANLLAATTTRSEARDQIYNIAVGDRTSLADLYATLQELLKERHPDLAIPLPAHEPFRSGDVRHSQADIGKAQRLLGFVPEYDVRTGLRAALPWYEARATGPARPLQPDVRGSAPYAG
jgi:UDP-N-acetylglucosamine/UDP-N-acetyl-alpha-D-glucosaminouronate 4-epimerase